MQTILSIRRFLVPIALLCGVGSASAQWTPQLVDAATGSSVGGAADHAIDSQGRSVILHRDATAGGLRLSFFDGAAWTTNPIDDPGSSNIGDHCALALDGDDIPHVVYHDAANSRLRYARLSESGWEFETIDAVGDSGRYCDLALDRNGDPHVVFRREINANNNRIHHATRTDGGAWQIGVIDDFNFQTGLYAALTLVPTETIDIPLVAYQALQGGSEVLKVAYRIAVGSTSAAWTRLEIASTGQNGFFNSIAVDAAGSIHVAHFRGDTLDLRYLRLAPGPGGALTIAESSVVAGPNSGTWSSLAIDSKNRPHVSYGQFDPIGPVFQSLRHSVRYPLGWLHSTAAVFNDTDPVEIGRFTSMVLAGGRDPRVAVQANNGSDTDLRMASFRDVTPPVARINGKNRIKTKKKSVRIGGVATDNLAVDRVEAVLGKGGFRPLPGTSLWPSTGWTATVKLGNKKRVRASVVAVDEAGNRSAIARVVIIQDKKKKR